MKKRFAALAIAVLLLFGVFALTGCWNKNIVEEQTDDMVTFYLPHWSNLAAVPGAITLQHTEKARFDCTIGRGEIYNNADNYGKRLTINHDPSLGDNQIDFFHVQPNLYGSVATYIEVIMWVDGYIAGYAVIYFYDDMGNHTELVKSALFPKVDGRYQRISKLQVKAIMKMIINEEKLS